MRAILSLVAVLTGLILAQDASAGMRSRILENKGPQPDVRSENDPRQSLSEEEIAERKREREEEAKGEPKPAPTPGGDQQFHKRDEHNRYEYNKNEDAADYSAQGGEHATPGGDEQFHKRDEHNRYERR